MISGVCCPSGWEPIGADDEATNGVAALGGNRRTTRAAAED